VGHPGVYAVTSPAWDSVRDCGGFTAIGKVQYSLPLSFWRKLVYFAALFLLPAIWGAESAFFAEPISDVAGPLVSIMVYLSVMKKGSG